jgi:ribose 5-phosphate isomerase B
MKIHLGCDHAGFEFKNILKAHLTQLGHQVVDHGAHEYDALDDYPAFCIKAAQAVAADAESLGIVIGGSGNGEQIAANKVIGVRAALGWSKQTAQLSREHNNANVMGLGARMHGTAEAIEIAETFINTEFSNDERHKRRINQLKDYETKGSLPEN